jgi:hypothetical protein
VQRPGACPHQVQADPGPGNSPAREYPRPGPSSRPLVTKLLIRSLINGLFLHRPYHGFSICEPVDKRHNLSNIRDRAPLIVISGRQDGRTGASERGAGPAAPPGSA